MRTAWADLMRSTYSGNHTRNTSCRNNLPYTCTRKIRVHTSAHKHRPLRGRRIFSFEALRYNLRVPSTKKARKKKMYIYIDDHIAAACINLVYSKYSTCWYSSNMEHLLPRECQYLLHNITCFYWNYSTEFIFSRRLRMHICVRKKNNWNQGRPSYC